MRSDVAGVERLAIEDRLVPGWEGDPDVGGAGVPAVDAVRDPCPVSYDPRRRVHHRKRGGRARGSGLHRRSRPERSWSRSSTGSPPSTRSPPALHDCYSALLFLAPGAGELGVDTRTGCGPGASAGGGLAAGTALLARDLGGPSLCFQMLQIPELDDRLETPSMRSFVDDADVEPAPGRQSWRGVSGGAPAGEDVSPYAAPARADRPFGTAAGVHLDGREGSAT